MNLEESINKYFQSAGRGCRPTNWRAEVFILKVAELDAVRDEAYEEAAYIRDKISKLEKDNENNL